MNGTTALSRRSFGETMRPDLWWTQPLLVFLGLINVHRLFDVGGVSGYTLLLRQLRLAVLFAGTVRRFAAQLVRTEARRGGLAGLSFRRRSSFFGRRADFGSPVIIIAEPITRRSGPTRRRAPSASRARPISASVPSRSSCRTCIAIFFIWRCLFILILAYDVWKALWFADPATGKNSFGIGVGTIVLAINVVLAGRLYLWLSLAAPSDRRISRSALQIANLLPRLRLRQLSQSPPHALGLDEFVLGRIHRSLRAALLDGRLA